MKSLMVMPVEATFTGHKGSCLASDYVERSSFLRIPLIDAAKIALFYEPTKHFY